jgi:hypothetical protein
MFLVFESDFGRVAQEVLTEIGSEKFDFDAVHAAEKRLREIIKNSGSRRYEKEQLVRYAMFFGQCFREIFGATYFLYDDGSQTEMCVGFGEIGGCYINPYEMVFHFAYNESFSITSLFHYIRVMLNKRVFLDRFSQLDFDELEFEDAA